MTVCVAALCEGNVIVGASDRMITAGDTQFEPEQSKIWVLTSSIVAMISGDSSYQTEILLDVESAVRARIVSRPDEWWSVRDVTELYIYFYSIARRKRAEVSILAPLGLTYDTFIRRQKELAPGVADQINTDLTAFSFRCGSVIFAGVDTTGAHIYVTADADMRCVDSIGFAAIGMGRSHANSQFMFRRHSRKKDFPETLFLTYSAKKRAEIAPGVGSATDMFMMGPALGTYTPVNPKHLIELEKTYQSNHKKEKAARLQAEVSVRKYVDQILEASRASKQGTIQDGEPGGEDVQGGIDDDQGGAP